MEENATAQAAYTPGSLAMAIGVHKSTIFGVIRSGQLRAQKLGSRTIIRADSQDIWQIFVRVLGKITEAEVPKGCES